MSQLTRQREGNEHMLLCVKEVEGRMMTERRADANNDWAHTSNITGERIKHKLCYVKHRVLCACFREKAK